LAKTIDERLSNAVKMSSVGLVEKRLVIVTGLAGAGKSVAIRALEDLGYACIDNLPASLLDPFLENLAAGTLPDSNVALALDSRDPLNPQKILDSLQKLSSAATVDVLFLEAQETVILKRFRETRRVHPLSKNTDPSMAPLTLGQAIDRDGALLKNLRAAATRVVDTTAMTSEHLRKLVRHDYAITGSETEVLFNIISFGFKYGVPPDVDCIFDVRCFANPHYVATLRSQTGQSEAVKEYVFADVNVMGFLDRITDLISFLHPLYQNEGKRYFGIGIGCTGGKHRSVAIAEELAQRLKEHVPLVALEHRHMDRDSDR
jgi:RNase adapter protein RapZ